MNDSDYLFSLNSKGLFNVLLKLKDKSKKYSRRRYCGHKVSRILPRQNKFRSGKKMKEFKEIVVSKEMVEKYPLLMETLGRTYEGIEILVYSKDVFEFINANIETKSLAIIVEDLPMDVFSEVEWWYKKAGREGISVLTLIRPRTIDNDIAFDFYFSSFMEARIKKAWWGKRNFNIKYRRIGSKYVGDISEK